MSDIEPLNLWTGAATHSKKRASNGMRSAGRLVNRMAMVVTDFQIVAIACRRPDRAQSARYRRVPSWAAGYVRFVRPERSSKRPRARRPSQACGSLRSSCTSSTLLGILKVGIFVGQQLQMEPDGAERILKNHCISVGGYENANGASKDTHKHTFFNNLGRYSQRICLYVCAFINHLLAGTPSISTFPS